MKPEEINPDTGRAYGDHGTANQAIEFALDHPSSCGFVEDFLICWREGDLDDWPEYYEWLETQA